MRRGNQLSRQRRLLQLIDRPAGITVEDAAQELACAFKPPRDFLTRQFLDQIWGILHRQCGDGRSVSNGV